MNRECDGKRYEQTAHNIQLVSQENDCVRNLVFLCFYEVMVLLLLMQAIKKENEESGGKKTSTITMQKRRLADAL